MSRQIALDTIWLKSTWRLAGLIQQWSNGIKFERRD